MNPVIKRHGGVAHLILGEAYYAGGLILMITFGWGLLSGGKRIVVSWWRISGNRDSRSLIVLFSLFLGYVIILSFNPGLQIRLVYLFLGLWISSPKTVARDKVRVQTHREFGSILASRRPSLASQFTIHGVARTVGKRQD